MVAESTIYLSSLIHFSENLKLCSLGPLLVIKLFIHVLAFPVLKRRMLLRRCIPNILNAQDLLGLKTRFNKHYGILISEKNFISVFRWWFLSLQVLLRTVWMVSPASMIKKIFAESSKVRYSLLSPVLRWENKKPGNKTKSNDQSPLVTWMDMKTSKNFVHWKNRTISYSSWM